MPSDNRTRMEKGWQTILDKVAIAFGKSDTYIDQNLVRYKAHQNDLAAGITHLPNEHSWYEALAMLYMEPIIKNDLKECLERRKVQA